MLNVMLDGLIEVIMLQDNLVINTNIFSAVKFQYHNNASPVKHNIRKRYLYVSI